MTRRGSVKRGSIVEDEEALEAKKLKATLEAMGMMKKKQKEFTWDSVKSQNIEEDEEAKPKRKGSKNNSGLMSKEAAMKILKLDYTEGKVTKPRNISDFTEIEVLVAFQTECKRLSMSV